jgi:sulfur transfer complex TusBCD TusB component (DsrH family)
MMPERQLMPGYHNGPHYLFNGRPYIISSFSEDATSSVLRAPCFVGCDPDHVDGVALFRQALQHGNRSADFACCEDGVFVAVNTSPSLVERVSGGVFPISEDFCARTMMFYDVRVNIGGICMFVTDLSFTVQARDDVRTVSGTLQMHVLDNGESGEIVLPLEENRFDVEVYEAPSRRGFPAFIDNGESVTVQGKFIPLMPHFVCADFRWTSSLRVGEATQIQPEYEDAPRFTPASVDFTAVLVAESAPC